MTRIRRRVMIADVKSGGQTKTSRESIRQIGEYVAEHICSQDHIKRLRSGVKLRGQGVDVDLAQLNSRVLPGHCLYFPHKKAIGNDEDVALTNDGHMLPARGR